MAADAITIVFVVLPILWWPIAQLIDVLIFVLSPFWAALTFLLLPFIHIGHITLNVLSSPFSIKWRDRFETIYVFLGVAALIGCATGTIVFVIYKLLSSMLNIDATIVPTAAEKPRSAAEYRAARRERKEEIQHAQASTPVVLKKVTGSRRRGLLSQAIMEEEDSDF